MTEETQGDLNKPWGQNLEPYRSIERTVWVVVESYGTDQRDCIEISFSLSSYISYFIPQTRV